MSYIPTDGIKWEHVLKVIKKLTYLSIILVNTGNINIGGELLFVPLGIGLTRASFYSLGNFLHKWNRLISLDSNRATLLAVCFNILSDILSQPVNLVMSRVVNNSKTNSFGWRGQFSLIFPIQREEGTLPWEIFVTKILSTVK